MVNTGGERELCNVGREGQAGYLRLIRARDGPRRKTLNILARAKQFADSRKGAALLMCLCWARRGGPMTQSLDRPAGNGHQQAGSWPF